MMIAASFRVSLRRRLELIALPILVAVSCNPALGVEPVVAVTVNQADDAFVVDVLLEVAVRPDTVWDVLTDFEHMTSYIGNLKSSQVTRRNGNTLVVRQEGLARYGLLSFAFESEREIRLEPKRRIVAKGLSGSARRMESEAVIGQRNDAVQVKYHAAVVPESFLARTFGAAFVHHEVDEQFRELAAEMLRRQKLSQ